jgi:hypothetical protein
MAANLKLCTSGDQAAIPGKRFSDGAGISAVFSKARITSTGITLVLQNNNAQRLSDHDPLYVMEQTRNNRGGTI